MAYVTVNVEEDFVSVSFDAGEEALMELGSKMGEVSFAFSFVPYTELEEAYMNGYNWDAFINSYLEENAPELLESIDSDPEAEMYCVYVEDEDTANKLASVIEALLGDESLVLSFLKENADSIEWD